MPSIMTLSGPNLNFRPRMLSTTPGPFAGPSITMVPQMLGDALSTDSFLVTVLLGIGAAAGGIAAWKHFGGPAGVMKKAKTAMGFSGSRRRGRGRKR